MSKMTPQRNTIMEPGETPRAQKGKVGDASFRGNTMKVKFSVKTPNAKTGK